MREPGHHLLEGWEQASPFLEVPWMLPVSIWAGGLLGMSGLYVLFINF